PFAYRFDRTRTARAALEGFREGDAALHRLAGRLVALRPHGKTTFAHLADQSGRIQLYFKQDELGADAYELLGLLDLGDLVGVEGPLFKTKTGEISVRVQRLTLLTKSLRPLPLGKEDASGVRHGELSDPELRARQRYADLAVHPEVRELFRLRARVVTYLRGFLDGRGYLEVETPVLQPLYGGATAGVDLGRASEGELRAALERRNVAEAEALAGPKLIDEVFKTYAEPTLVQPTFVLDYPIALSPLAKPRRGDSTKAERWELFI